MTAGIGRRHRITAPPRRTGGGRVPCRGLGGVLALLLLTGCAYYNTFYHARRFYSDAEKARETETRATLTTAASAAPGGQGQGATRSNDLYKKSIEKCQKVLENFPGSRWEDDAYLLMAQAYYGKGDYLSARRELDRFGARFPQSDLLPEAVFWQGLTAFAQEDYSSAGTIWNGLLEKHPKYEGRERVEFHLAETLDRRKLTEEAVQAYGAFLERHPKGAWSTDARIQLGLLQMDARRYPEAERVFAEVASRAPEEEDRVKAKLLLGESLESQGRGEEALELYQNLAVELDPNMLEGRMTREEREALIQEELAKLTAAREDSLANARYTARDSTGATRTATQTAVSRSVAANEGALNPNRHMLPQTDIRYDQLARVMLREGIALAQVGRPVDAILAFEQILAEYPRTPYASEAQYRIGYVYEVDMDQFDEAQKAYGKVAGHGRSSFTEDAARRARSLSAVKSLTAAPADSASRATASAAEGRFLRAELYLFQQEKPERAVEEYESIQRDFKGTDHAAKAALAEAWVRVAVMADTARGRAKYAEVMRSYEDTEYGRRASRVLRGPERELRSEEFAGPSIEELRAPENLAAIAARDSAQAAREKVAIDQARAEAVRDSLAREEAARASAAAEPGVLAQGEPGMPGGMPPPGSPGGMGPHGGPGGPERGAAPPRKLSAREMATMGIPRGPSGNPLDPLAIPVDGWTPVLGAPPDSAELARRAQGSGRRVVHTLVLPDRPDSVMATPIGVVAAAPADSLGVSEAAADSLGAGGSSGAAADSLDAARPGAPADTTGAAPGGAQEAPAAPADTTGAAPGGD